MSMHQYMPDQAVLADSWTLFCPECAQKMRIIMAAPARDGKKHAPLSASPVTGNG